MKMENVKYKMKESRPGVEFLKMDDGCELVSVGGKVRYSVEPSGKIVEVLSYLPFDGGCVLMVDLDPVNEKGFESVVFGKN